jgi:hypothetical protein
MSNSHSHLTKLRLDTYKLEVTWAVVVLKDKGDGTEVWALDIDRKPALVATTTADFLTVACEIVEGHCDPLESFLQEIDDERNRHFEIEAERANERWFEDHGYDTDGVWR